MSSRVPLPPAFTSNHVVNIKNVFHDGSEVVTVYEVMDVSLRDVISILGEPFKSGQIGTICSEAWLLLPFCWPHD